MNKVEPRAPVQYEIQVTLNGDVPEGLLRDKLILKTNEIGVSEVSIPIEARVEPDFVVTDAQFGTVAPDHSKSITVVIRGKKPFQIENVQHVAREIAAKSVGDGALPKSNDPHFEHRAIDRGNSFKVDFSTTVAQIHKLTLTMTPPTEARHVR